jgi:hypothetical protein
MPISESAGIGFTSTPNSQKLAGYSPYLAIAITLTQDFIGFQAK